MTRKLLRRRHVGVVVLIAAALVGGWWAVGRSASADAPSETAEVTRGTFLDRATVRGEIKALRSLLLTAPSDAGELRILEIVRNGAAVKKGDVVIAFDATSLSTKLQEKQSELRASDAEIAKAAAEGRLSLEEVTTGRVTAEYDVERSRLDVKAGELSSRFDEQKARLTLSDKEQKLRETDTSLDSGRQVTAATVRGLEGKRERAVAEVGRTSKGLAALVLRAPIDGVMVVLDNWRASSFGEGGRPFQVGDNAWPGAQIAELPDLATARMTANVDEVDRSRLAVGKAATIRIDALSDVELPAKIFSISTLAKTDMSTWPPKRGFEVVLELTRVEPRLRPGMSAVARVAVASYDAQVLVPSRALHQRDGQTVVYVVTRRGDLEPRPVKVAHRNDDTTAISEGLQPGDRVSLVPPEEAATTRDAAAKETT